MKRTCCCLALALCVLAVPLFAQAQDATKIMADARAALGGEKRLSALQTLTATGQSVRVTADGSQAPTDWEMAFQLPDKFMKKDVIQALGPSGAITRTSGFNGDSPIDVIDQPPQTGNQMRFVFRSGPGDAEGTQTPEQQEQTRKKAVTSARQDFSQLLLGFIVAPSPAYPLEFTYGGQAESADGKADIIDVKGDGGFAARLFIDTKTHLPLMLSWMAREPIRITRTVGGGPGAKPPADGAGHVTMTAPAHGGQPLTPEERDKMMKQAQEQAAQQMKDAQAKARIVEYRLYYGDYRDVDGVKLPFQLQRSIDGKPTEQVTLDKVKVNGKIDPKKFETK